MNKMFRIVFFLLCIGVFTYPGYGQSSSIIISGRVTEKLNGRPLESVYISTDDYKYLTISNSQGFYNLSIPRESTTIQFSLLGYEKNLKKISGQELFKDSIKLRLVLKPLNQELKEVEISGSRAPEIAF